jgi:hypothetical protein
MPPLRRRIASSFRAVAQVGNSRDAAVPGVGRAFVIGRDSCEPGQYSGPLGRGRRLGRTGQRFRGLRARTCRLHRGVPHRPNGCDQRARAHLVPPSIDGSTPLGRSPGVTGGAEPESTSGPLRSTHGLTRGARVKIAAFLHATTGTDVDGAVGWNGRISAWSRPTMPHVDSGTSFQTPITSPRGSETTSARRPRTRATTAFRDVACVGWGRRWCRRACASFARSSSGTPRSSRRRLSRSCLGTGEGPRGGRLLPL